MKVLEFAREMGFDNISFLGEWKGYDVYEPIFEGDGVYCIGMPEVILVNEEKIRLSTNEEAFECLDVLYDPEECVDLNSLSENEIKEIFLPEDARSILAERKKSIDELEEI